MSLEHEVPDILFLEHLQGVKAGNTKTIELCKILVVREFITLEMSTTYHPKLHKS